MAISDGSIGTLAEAAAVGPPLAAEPVGTAGPDGATVAADVGAGVVAGVGVRLVLAQPATSAAASTMNATRPVGAVRESGWQAGRGGRTSP
jgi:hypothetical protein